VKATLFLTTACNLRCDYCYVQKQGASMPEDRLQKAIDFAFRVAGPVDRIDFGLFGGEPLLEWELAQRAVALIEQRTKYSENDVRVSLVTNGTLLDDEMLRFIRDHRLILQVSIDGIPTVQDVHRRFADDRPTSGIVEKNLKAAVSALPAVLVNVVYTPDTFSYLPESAQYLASLGLKQIVLNPDYSAKWLPEHIAGLAHVYSRLADLYVEYYLRKNPLFISLIDEKIAVILRGGYEPTERCHMGYNELAFSPAGFIFPCERLVGNGQQNQHCIGHIDRPRALSRSHCPAGGTTCRSAECQHCTVAAFCMNWCGCTNFLATGDYALASHFLCASERLAIEAALNVLSRDDVDHSLAYINHYAGLPMLNSSLNAVGNSLPSITPGASSGHSLPVSRP
jgi:uncharacterized protein